MNFQIKIILITLLILITTLLLNSILSLASFEKLYVSSLISTYELAGKNLKRKVEQALRFGKPLKQFEGMDRLLKEVVDKNPHISSIGIGTPQGEILYHIDERLVGEEFPYSMPILSEEQQVSSKLIEGKYITFLPLFDRSKKMVGFINLSFSREVVYNKLKSMATENLKVLWIMMLITSLGLIFFLTVLIIQPIKRDITHIGEILKWPADNSLAPEPNYQTEKQLLPLEASLSQQPMTTYHEERYKPTHIFRPKFIDVRTIRNEVHQLGWYIYKFVEHAYLMLQHLQYLKKEQHSFAAAYKELQDSQIELTHLLDESTISLEDSKIKRLHDIVANNQSLLEASRFILDASTESEATSLSKEMEKRN